jgi:hypothetical protein
VWLCLAIATSDDIAIGHLANMMALAVFERESRVRGFSGSPECQCSVGMLPPDELVKRRCDMP